VIGTVEDGVSLSNPCLVRWRSHGFDTSWRDMKTVTLGVGLIGLILLSFGCAVDTAGDDRGQWRLTIEAARISRSDDQFLVEGTSQVSRSRSSR